MAVGCGVALRLKHRFSIDHSLRARVAREEWQRILRIYVVAVICLIGVLWLTRPEALFSLVMRRPQLWLLVMIAYPLISVFPQELIYRAFFFERYRPLFGRGNAMWLGSAVAFSFGHIVFHNMPAVALTLIGGWLFAQTYARTNSLRAVLAEHALYGWAIFTVGYGEFFFDGTMRLFR